MDDVSTTTEIELPLDRDAAWELITDTETLGGWLGGTVDLVPEVGYEGTIQFDDETVVLVEEVVPGERLRFRWASATKPPSTVEFELDGDCISTRLIVTERPVPQGLAACRIQNCASAAAVR